MRVLGVDPGLTRCGVGLIDVDARRQSAFVHVAVITTPTDAPLCTRLLLLEEGLQAIVSKFQPDAVAVERVFSQHNVRTAMSTAQASAIALLVAAKHGIDVAMYTPTEVKAAVTGSGRADKTQVTAMVTKILKLQEAPKPADAADALALALCHSWRGIGQTRIAHALHQLKAVSS